VEGYTMSKSSNITWSVVALTTFSIVFGIPLEAAAQQPRLILPVSNIRSLSDYRPVTADAIARFPRVQTQPVSVRRMNKATRASIVALAAAGGFFGGGFAGALLENTLAPCGCDDPGLQGALIGAPVGAIAAGVVTFALLPKP
jgi:hypothetical protein